MKLYIYDHCPYCVKARMIFGFKKVPVKLVYLSNDDVETPTSMIGVKMTPVLKLESAKYMPESLDIISYIDKEFPPALVFWDKDIKLTSWLKKVGSLYYLLAMPRWVQSPLEEFKTESSQNYFQNRLESKVGSFEELLDQTEELKATMEGHLLKLEPLLQEGNFFIKDKLSINDFNLFVILRSLTIVRDLKFPVKVENYMKYISKESQVPLHTLIAL